MLPDPADYFCDDKVALCLKKNDTKASNGGVIA
jgi:hypothetical protein